MDRSNARGEELAMGQAPFQPISFFTQRCLHGTLSRYMELSRLHHTRVHAHLDDETLQMLRAYAKAHGLSMSAVIRQSVRRVCVAEAHQPTSPIRPEVKGPVTAQPSKPESERRGTNVPPPSPTPREQTTPGLAHWMSKLKWD
jgi:hypothetical protein